MSKQLIKTFSMSAEFPLILKGISEQNFERYIESAIAMYLGVQELKQEQQIIIKSTSAPINSEKESITVSIDEDLCNYLEFFVTKNVIDMNDFVEKAVAMYIGMAISRRDMFNDLAKPLMMVTMCCMHENGFMPD